MKREIFSMLVGLWMTLILATSALADLNGVYKVSVTGVDVNLSGRVVDRTIRDNTTVKVTLSGRDLTIEIGKIDGMHAATRFKGKRDSYTGRFVAVWWYQGYPYQTQVVTGTLKNNRIHGEMIYPRVVSRLVPGWLKVQFSGQKLKMAPPPPPNRTVKPMPPYPLPLPKEDCINFNPDRIRVEFIQNRWKLVEGRHWIFDFDSKPNEAVRAAEIIRHYGLNRVCYVGRPEPSMTYLLLNNNSPVGSFRGEDCIPFDPDKITVKNINGKWKIAQGSMWLMDFGPMEKEARTALSIIKHYRFTQQCFVGRPNPSFVYWRR